MSLAKSIRAFQYWRGVGFEKRHALFLAIKHGMPGRWEN